MNGPVIGEPGRNILSSLSLTSPRPYHRRLRVSIPRLALDLLDLPHPDGYRRRPHLSQQGNLWTSDPAQDGSAET